MLSFQELSPQKVMCLVVIVSLKRRLPTGLLSLLLCDTETVEINQSLKLLHPNYLGYLEHSNMEKAEN